MTRTDSVVLLDVDAVPTAASAERLRKAFAPKRRELWTPLAHLLLVIGGVLFGGFLAHQAAQHPPEATIAPSDWTPATWHGVTGHAVQWRVTPAGIEERSGDGPAYVRQWSLSIPKAKRELPQTVWAHAGNRAAIEFAAEVIGLDVATVLTLVVTESQGDPTEGDFDPWVNEAGETIVDGSWGLTQTLTDTAWSVARSVGWPMRQRDTVHPPYVEAWLLPERSLLRGGDEAEWRAFLGDRTVGATIGALVFREAGRRWKTRGDVLLTYAAYNSGGVRVGANRYGLDATQAAVEAFVLYWNRAVEVVR